MIGKIIVVIFAVILFAMLTGVDFTPMYHKMAESRNTATPYVDQIVENTLQYSANVHLQEKLQPYINQLQEGKN